MTERDTQSIVNLINLYGLAVDTQRWNLFDRIFTPDVDADFSASAHWHDLEKFKSDFAVFHDPFDSTQHAMMNHLVSLTGDTAHAFTYGTWRLIRRGLEGGDFWEGTGWYDDDLVRSASGWLIKRRTCRIVWWGGNPLVQETIPGVRFELQSLSVRREGEAGRVRYFERDLSGVGVDTPLPSASSSILMAAPLDTEPAPSGLTIPGYLSEITARYGASVALVLHTKDEDTHWSYETLRERSTELARALIAIGVGKDSRVGVLMSNRPEFVAAAFAIALAGGVTVVLSTFSTAPELGHLIKVSGVSVLLYERKVARKDFDEILCELEPAIGITAPLRSTKFPFLRHLVRFEPHRPAGATGAIESWPEFLQRARAVPLALVEAIASHVKPSDAALLFFSSGTTGLPKGILHAQRAAVIQWWRWPRILGVTGDVRCWTANGFFWSGQFSMVLGCGLSCGGAVVLQPTFDPAEALELIQSQRVTMPFAWPHQWAKLREAPNWNSVDLGSLRYVDPRSPLAQHPTVRPTDWHEPPAYGATETFTIVAALPDFKPGRGRQSIQGPPLPGNAIKIVDPLSGAVLPREQRGEIAVKGPTLMLGYLGIPLSETLDAEGYFHTGDGGYVDEAGQLFWEGRLSDTIKTGGANVSPREIDSVLMTYPGIKLCRTVGIPHDALGEAVVACIVPHEQAVLEERAIRDFLKTRLASYKVPRHLLLFSEEEIAKTGSDKIKADALVLRAAARLACAAE